MANQALRYTIEADSSQAEAAHKRIHGQLATIEQLAVQTGRTFGSVFEAMGHLALKGAEGVGAVLAAHRLLRAEIEAGSTAIATYSINWSGLLNTIRGIRLALSPTLLTGATITAGVLIEETIRAGLERNRAIQAQSLLAASSGRSFASIATAASAEDFQGLRAGTLSQLKQGPGTIIGVIDQLRGVKDPVERARIAQATFGDDTAKVLPLLTERLRDNITAAYEFSEVYDTRTRTALAGLAESIHKPIDALHELGDAWRYAKEETSQ